MSTKTYKRLNESHDSMAVFQDCSTTFNESPVNPKKCRSLLAKLYKLIINSTSSEPVFKPQEATSLFFSISKLFQHQDNDSLRQYVYLVIKELATMSDDILMATASIMKDIQSSDSIIKPNAIRSLIRVLDSSTALTAERLLKSSIISSNNDISSAALVSSYHLLKISDQTCKRLINETMETVDSKKNSNKLPTNIPPVDLNNEQQEKFQYLRVPNNHMSQYHALGLAYDLKKNDDMGLLKLIKQCDPTLVDNAFARMEILRLCSKLVERDHNKIELIVPYLEWALTGTSSNNFLVLEACKIILKLKYKPFYSIVVERLTYLINDRSISSKFSAVRLISKYCHLFEADLAKKIGSDIEVLVNSANKSISTYAITTLLKIGDSDNIESLINTLKVNCISDDFKIIIIDSLSKLISRFPKVITDFLLDSLRSHDGSNILKNKVVDCIAELFKEDEINVISLSESFKIDVLESLCDFIEDCEYTDVLSRVIYILGEYGSRISVDSSVFVRHIYNRINLENSIIRSSAVTALAKFPHITTFLLENISKNDLDDEVRDRAVITLTSKKIRKNVNVGSEKIYNANKYIKELEAKLNLYSQNGDFTNFDLPEVPDIFMEEDEDEEQDKNDYDTADSEDTKADINNDDMDDKSTDKKSEYILSTEQHIKSIYTDIGKLRNVSELKKLTDDSSEFVIRCSRFDYDGDEAIFDLEIKNTLDFPVNNLNIEGNEQEAVIIHELKPYETAHIYVKASILAGQKYWNLLFIADDFQEVFEFDSY